MPSVQSIRKRITGISKTKQITRSMRLVSFSKVQKSRAIFLQNLPYHDHAVRMIDILSGTYEARRHRAFVMQEVKTTGIVAISTDRGLCGAYNMNVVRQTARLVKRKRDVYLIAVGSKCVPALRREGIEVDFNYIGISESPIVEEAEMLSAQLLELFWDGTIDEIFIVHHQFENMLSQRVVRKRLLPYPPKEERAKGGAWSFEPDAERMIPEAIHIYLTAVIYNAILESALCEQSARVASMDAASRNSDELLEKLTLLYNKQRQEIITNEIIEVVSGATSQKKRGSRV